MFVPPDSMNQQNVLSLTWTVETGTTSVLPLGAYSPPCGTSAAAPPTLSSAEASLSDGSPLPAWITL